MGNLHLILQGVTFAVPWELRPAKISQGTLSTESGFLQSWQRLIWSLDWESVESELCGARSALACLLVLNVTQGASVLGRDNQLLWQYE